MELRYSNTINDMIAFNDFHYANSVAMKKMARRYRWGWAFGLFFLLLLVLYLVSPKSSLTPKIFFSGFGAICFFFLFPSTYKNAVSRQARKLYSEGSNNGFLGEHLLRIEPDGLVEFSSFGESKTLWHGIERVVSTDAYSFVYVGSIQSHVIPHAAIIAGNLPDFLELLKSKLA